MATTFQPKPEIEVPLADLASRLQPYKAALVNRTVQEFINREALEDNRSQETFSTLKPDLFIYY